MNTNNVLYIPITYPFSQKSILSDLRLALGYPLAKNETFEDNLSRILLIINAKGIEKIILESPAQTDYPPKFKITQATYNLLMELMALTDLPWIFRFEVEEAYERTLYYLQEYGGIVGYRKMNIKRWEDFEF